MAQELRVLALELPHLRLRSPQLVQVPGLLQAQLGELALPDARELPHGLRRLRDGGGARAGPRWRMAEELRVLALELPDLRLRAPELVQVPGLLQERLGELALPAARREAGEELRAKRLLVAV